MKLLVKFIRKTKEEGILHASKLSLKVLTKKSKSSIKNSVLKLFPEGKHAKYNEVKVPKITAPKKNHSFLPDYLSPNNPDYKWHYICFMRKYIEEGEKVVVIGGGRGVSSVVAARQVGEKGEVKIYEGSPEMVDKIAKTLEINSVKNICQIEQKIVGPGIEVWTEDDKSIKAKSPKKLEKHDVLFMDCEGAELEIMKNLSFDPKKIIVEMHPYRYMKKENFNISSSAFIGELKNREYKKFEFRHSNDKYKELSEEEMIELLEKKYLQKKGKVNAGLGPLSVFAKK